MWEGGHPVSKLFDDPFYSTVDGRREVDHVFLAGNRLPERWREAEHFSIAELGFGTGLSFLQTWHIWRQHRRTGQKLRFTSFEAYPLTLDAIAQALANWPGLEPLAVELLGHWLSEKPGAVWPMDAQTTLQLVIGDARETLPVWAGAADAWYLDGFSPARNPQMWEAELMAAVAAHTSLAGSVASYTSAGWVRRNLQAAGFSVEKRPGFGSKREMISGILETG